MSATLLVSDKTNEDVGRFNRNQDEFSYASKRVRKLDFFEKRNEFHPKISVERADFNEGTLRPLVCVESEEFYCNLRALSARFPTVDKELISSLLENTLNDLPKTSGLISEFFSKTVGRRSTRKRPGRDWPDGTLSKTAKKSELKCIEEETSARKYQFTDNLVENYCHDGCFKQRSDTSAENSTLLVSKKDHLTHENRYDPLKRIFPKSTSDILCGIENSSNPAKQIEPSYGKCYQDAKEQTSSSELVEEPTLQKSVSKLNIGHPRGVRESLKLLSRVVLSQYDKIGTLQSAQSIVLEENKELQCRISALSKEIETLREANRALKYYITLHGLANGENRMFPNEDGNCGKRFDRYLNRDVF